MRAVQEKSILYMKRLDTENRLRIYLTEEKNGFALFSYDRMGDNSLHFIEWFWFRDEAIEKAVNFTKEMLPHEG